MPRRRLTLGQSTPGTSASNNARAAALGGRPLGTATPIFHRGAGSRRSMKRSSASSVQIDPAILIESPDRLIGTLDRTGDE
jgi:hypothetical protein